MQEDLLKEIWKSIKNYEGLYEISNYGRVKSINRLVKGRWGFTKINEKILNLVFDKDGYLIVTLCKDGKQKVGKVHRLVAEAFLDNPNNYPVINHIDGRKENNNVENLEFCTQSHNVKEAYRLGLEKPQLTGLGKLGIKNKKAMKIKQIDLATNEVVNYYYGTLEAQRNTGINFRNIHMCLNGKRKSAGGYIWRYASGE